MRSAILEFAELLRRHDIPVTTGEILDALEATCQIPFGDKDLFRDVLRSTLIKNWEHIPEFERLFELHFCSVGGLLESAVAGHQGPFEGLRGIGGLPQEVVAGISTLSVSLLSGNSLALEHKAMEAARAANVSEIEYPLQAGSFVRRMTEYLEWDSVKDELERLLYTLGKGGLGEEELQGLQEAIQRNKEVFLRLLRTMIRLQVEKNRRPARHPFVVEGLTGKSFTSLSEEEITEMREMVALLVQRLRTKMAVINRRQKRGRLQLRKTLRINMENGGIPFEMVFKVKKRRKSKVIALCDVSSSVWTASRFMLNLLYAIQDQFAEVRSFVFVSELGEVTSFFKNYGPNEAIQRALRDGAIRYHSYSDYGDVFLEFHEKYLGELNYRTIVIIIGDGRNNYLPTRSWVLQEMRERCRKIIWLNPEPRSMWGTGDSAIWEYAPFCTELEECRNLKQLADFVDKLII